MTSCQTCLTDFLQFIRRKCFIFFRSVLPLIWLTLYQIIFLWMSFAEMLFNFWVIDSIHRTNQRSSWLSSGLLPNSLVYCPLIWINKYQWDSYQWHQWDDCAIGQCNRSLVLVFTIITHILSKELILRNPFESQI